MKKAGEGLKRLRLKFGGEMAHSGSRKMSLHLSSLQTHHDSQRLAAREDVLKKPHYPSTTKLYRGFPSSPSSSLRRCIQPLHKCLATVLFYAEMEGEELFVLGELFVPAQVSGPNSSPVLCQDGVMYQSPEEAEDCSGLDSFKITKGRNSWKKK